MNEEKEKDRILQAIMDVLEAQLWGDRSERTIIKVYLQGKLDLKKIEVEYKVFPRI